MTKFTIFTIILAVSAIVIMADLGVRQYFGDAGQANVLGAGQEISPVIADDSDNSAVEPNQAENQDFSQDQQSNENFTENPATEIQASDSPQQPYTTHLTESLIRQAGLTGTFTEEHFEGKIFQLLDITKNPVSGISLFEVGAPDGAGQAATPPVASITEITLPDEIRALQLYVLLQNKTKPYIDLTLNETNAYGDRSFYINHAKKPDEAFLTVKVGARLYSIAYVKLYHPQIKKLIELLIENN